MDNGFVEFWQVYPRKTAKFKAQQVWKKLNPDDKLSATILKGVKKQKTSLAWTKENGQFIPYPSTYLNQHRWEDELTYNSVADKEKVKSIQQTLARKKEALSFVSDESIRGQELRQDIEFWESELAKLNG